eukprot:5620225-Amphidinium_carterae.1
MKEARKRADAKKKSKLTRAATDTLARTCTRLASARASKTASKQAWLQYCCPHRRQARSHA